MGSGEERLGPNEGPEIRQVYEKVGGFGHLLMLVYDWEPRQKMLTSLELLATEVMPKLAGLL